MIGVAKFKKHGAHFDENTFGISYARSYLTLRDGSFEGRFPRHFVPGYDRCCPYGTRWQTFRKQHLAKVWCEMSRRDPFKKKHLWD